MSASKLSPKVSQSLKLAVVIFGITLVAQVLSRILFDAGWVGILFSALFAMAGALLIQQLHAGVFGVVDANKSGLSPNVGAVTDNATGVLSLRSLTISLLESMALAERYTRDLTLVQIVIDDFDGVQSRFGSSAVDAAAAVLGSSILNAVRMPDRVGRYASNCFILVLPETDAIGARQFSERIRRLIVDEEIRAGKGQRFSISVSAGVATFESGDDPQRLIERTEQAVEEAQSLGGNRTVISSINI